MARDDESKVEDNLDLETSFPDPTRVFDPFNLGPITPENVLVALDTNVLLVPYHITKDDLAAIGTIYKQLAAQKRLFLPARAAREFAKHRDRKLAEMVRAINEIKNRFPAIDKRLSPLLVGLDGYSNLETAYDELMKAKLAYSKALDPLIQAIRNWRGDDPVSSMYKQVFTADRVVEAGGTAEELESEWASRSVRKRPPGYKDTAKPDKGIGDFLIWKSILAIASEHKKDLVFVTNETKSDWFIRSGNEALYPRMELVDEYRSHSDGHKLRLCSLHQMLREMNADEKVVEEVKTAEVIANTAVTVSSSHRQLFGGEVVFDYSRNNGRTMITYGYQKTFSIKFSKASDRAIHLYRDDRDAKVARIKSPRPGQRLYFDELDSSSNSYTIQPSEGFAVLNPDGYLLIGRITDIKYDGRNDDHDEVRFLYNISGPEDPGEMP